MTEITQRIRVAEFALRYPQKQNGWVKRRKSNMKDITEVYIAYWRFHLR